MVKAGDLDGQDVSCAANQVWPSLNCTGPILSVNMKPISTCLSTTQHTFTALSWDWRRQGAAEAKDGVGAGRVEGCVEKERWSGKWSAE